MPAALVSLQSADGGSKYVRGFWCKGVWQVTFGINEGRNLAKVIRLLHSTLFIASLDHPHCVDYNCSETYVRK